MLEQFIKSVTTARLRFIRRQDDNWVDRLNSRVTVTILVAVTALISLAQWVRKPFNCWLPKNFDVIHRDYIHAHCWVTRFYYLPYTHEIPKVEEADKRDVILYYQWIPWILLTQAFLFWLPSGVWHWLSEKSGMNTDNILDMAKVLNETRKLDKRESRVEILAGYMDYFMRQKCTELENGKCCDCGKSSTLLLSYLFTKLLYITNLVFQIFALGALLTTDYRNHLVNHIHHYYGANSTEDGQVWNSPIFPRVAFCDYDIRALGNNRRYTAQCMLSFNIYLERLYLFLWVWIMLLLLLTTIDLLIWLMRAVFKSDRVNFISNQLHQANRITSSTSERNRVLLFLDDYLRQDGAFVLRLIAHNTSAATSADITGQLWDMWKEHNFPELLTEDIYDGTKHNPLAPSDKADETVSTMV